MKGLRPLGKDDSALICQLVDVRGPTTVLGNPEEHTVDVGAVNPFNGIAEFIYPSQPHIPLKHGRSMPGVSTGNLVPGALNAAMLAFY